MRHFLTLALSIAAALPLAAQVPQVGIVDFHGLRTIDEATIRRALPFKEGDPLPKSKGDIEEALESIRGVVRARLEAVCCDEGKAILYVGIEERGAPHFDYSAAPSGEVRLPEEVHGAYAAFLAAAGRAARSGNAGESLADGHSLLTDPAAREMQLRFIPLAETHHSVLRDVLKNSADEEHRAIAAYVLGYSANKRAIAGDLQAALKDPDDTVRNNAMRALAAIAVLASKQGPDVEPEARIRVPATWFVEMLDSLLWSDRATALNTLVTLTETRDRAALDHLRDRALPTLLEMARWKHLPHALPAFILAGRAAGLPETEIQEAWTSGSRDAMLRRLEPAPLKPEKKRRK